MVRQTSREAYDDIMASGKISKMRKHAYKLVYQHGPLTGSELDALVGGKENLHKRLSELEEMGVVYTPGRKICSITNREVLAWDVTPNKPVTTTVKRTSKDAIIRGLKARIRELESENHRLQRDLNRAVAKNRINPQ